MTFDKREGRFSLKSQYLVGKIDLEADVSESCDPPENIKTDLLKCVFLVPGKIDLQPDVIPEIGQIHLLQTFSESRTDLKVEEHDRESTTRIRMSIRMMMKKRIRQD